jgi:PAS domain S-box-containing protein
MPFIIMSGVTPTTREAAGLRSRFSYLATVLLLTAIYYVAAKFGLGLAPPNERQISLVWPPTGIALAVVLLLGYRVWPAIAAGAFITNLTTPEETVGSALGITVGNTLEALIGAWLLHRAGFQRNLHRLVDVLALVGLAASLSTAVSATVGVSSLCLSGIKPWSLFPTLWRNWWLGDAMGALVVAPALLTWNAWLPLLRQPGRLSEAICLITVLTLVSLIVFAGSMESVSTDHPFEYAIFPFVIWAALRFGPQGTAAVTLLGSAVAIWGTLTRFGPFARGSVYESLIMLQVFMAVVGITGLVLSAAISERNIAERRRATIYAVTQVLADSADLSEAAPYILRTICESLGWDVGALWRVDRPAGVLRCVDVWHVPDRPMPEFEAASRKMTFAPGAGLPGRVWQSAQPLSIPHLGADSNFARAPVVARAGLHGGFGFPILLGGEVLGVIEFYSKELREPPPELLRLMAALGGQIGQFLERQRVEAEVRDSEALKTAILTSALDAIVTIDHEGRIVEFNPAAERLLGFERSRVVGKVMADLIVPSRLREQHRQGLASYLATGATRVIGRRVEMAALRADGSELPIELTVTRIAGVEPPLFTGYLRDITERKRAEKRIRFQADMLDTVGQAVIATDLGGSIQYWNRYAESLYGWPAVEALGRNVLELVPAPPAREQAAEIMSCLRAGKSWTGEVLVQRRDASVFPALVTNTPVRDERGDLVGIIGLSADISAQKRAEMSQRFLAETSAALVASLDLDALFQQVARRVVPFLADYCFVDVVTDTGALRRVGRAHADPAKEALLAKLERFVPPGQGSGHPVTEAVRTGQVQFVPVVDDAWLEAAATGAEHLQCLRELEVRSLMTVPLLAAERKLGAIMFCHTAASGRRYTDEDLALAEELARRTALALENARLYNAVRDADCRKDDFLAMLAHELRNPLAPIRNAVEIARLIGVGDAKLKWAREVIDRQVTHMSRLVDDLLDVSRITRGKIQIQMQPVEVTAVVARAVETSRPLIEARRHELTVSVPADPIEIEADLTRLAQVIANLLNNAAKYTDEGGRIWLTVERQGDEVLFRVRDTGIGIPPDMLGKIFELFTQVDRSLDRSQGGLGIGLTLVRTLTEMHKGRVEAFSDGPGRGSEFVVRLPVLRPGSLPSPAKTADGRAHGPAARRILVVDDNVDAAESLALLLQIGGHEVRTAHDGPAVLSLAKTYLPEIIFLDIGLPGMDGYEIARRLRQQGETARALLVAVTGYGQEEDRRRSQEAGFDHHLTKPVNPQDLQSLLA